MGLSDGVSNLFTVRIDSVTQEIIFDALPISNGHAINAIGYRVRDNLVYGLDPFTLNLYKIDATGKSFLLRKLDELDPADEYFGADISPNGRIMVMIGGEGTDKNLVVINLDDPEHPLEIIPLKMASTGGAPNTRIVDVAFDPLTKDLYGVDINNFKLVTISFSLGTINDNIFPRANANANIAALFFDAFGNLFGYGDIGNGQYGMYRINKLTGQFEFATLGPSTGGVDGCSCPFNLSVEKKVYPDTAFVCSEVQYVFRMVNGSLNTQKDIILEDVLPPTFEIVGIDYNPFETTSIEGIGTNRLVMSGLSIPVGLDSIVLRVQVGNSPPGTYGNLAELKNLPPALGFTKFSENPSSLKIGNRDSTYITLVTPLTAVEKIDGICAGDSSLISIDVPNAAFAWQDGSTDSFYTVTQPGVYAVTVTTGCDTYTETFTVEEQSIGLDFTPNARSVVLGNSIQLQPNVLNTGDFETYSWTDPLGGTLDCYDCANPYARPLENVSYEVVVENEYGCTANASILINVEIDRELYIPNIFSPNNDGLNDRFLIKGAGDFEIALFHIYDRWGNLVHFENNIFVNSPDAGWDGTSGGKVLDAGVYSWQLQVKYLDNVERKMTGTITLVK